MNAKAITAAHYQAFEDHARDVEKAREVIDQLRAELHEVIADLKRLSDGFSDECQEYDRVISRAHKTLLRTLPGGELEEKAEYEAAYAQFDAMSKSQRRVTLANAITDMFGVKARI